jgi:hypothetical protein
MLLLRHGGSTIGLLTFDVVSFSAMETKWSLKEVVLYTSFFVFFAYNNTSNG